MKWISPIVVLALGAAAILLPSPAEPQPEAVPGTVSPPLAICPTEEGGTRSSELDVVSTAAGSGRISIFSGGGSVGSTTYETGASGSVAVPVGGIAAVGEAAGLVEFPVSESAATSITRGTGLLSAELCSRIPDRQVVVGGGTTTEDRIFQINLMNPYSAGAVVDITAFSESGRESADTLRSIVVPARSSVMVDVGSLLPGRESLNLVVDVTAGSVVTSASLEANGDQAIWRAAAPQEIWYAPLPVYAGSRELVIASATPSDVAFQVDVFGPDGLEEAAIEGTVAAGGQEIVDLGSLSPAAIAVRVVATAPVGVFARLSGDGGIALATASDSSAAEWLMPGAGSSRTAGRLVLVNVGVEPAQVTVTELRDDSRSRVVELPPNAVVEVTLDEVASHGVAVIADSQVIPMWVGQSANAIALSGGHPIQPEQ